jgi:GAF domain-containing protein
MSEQPQPRQINTTFNAPSLVVMLDPNELTKPDGGKYDLWKEIEDDFKPNAIRYTKFDPALLQRQNVAVIVVFLNKSNTQTWNTFVDETAAEEPAPYSIIVWTDGIPSSNEIDQINMYNVFAYFDGQASNEAILQAIRLEMDKFRQKRLLMELKTRLNKSVDEAIRDLGKSLDGKTKNFVLRKLLVKKPVMPFSIRQPQFQLVRTKPLKVILDFLEKYMKFDRCTVVLVTEKMQIDDKPWRFRAHFGHKGYEDEDINSKLLRPIEEDATMQGILDGERSNVYLNIQDSLKAPAGASNHIPSWKDDKIKSWIVIPLKAFNELVGIITLDYTGEALPHLPKCEGTRIYESTIMRFGEIIGTNIHNLMIRRNQKMLSSIIDAVAVKDDVEHLLKEIVEKLKWYMKADLVAYFKREDPGEGLSYLEQWSASDEPDDPMLYPETKRNYLEGEGVAGWILKDAQKRIVHDVKHHLYGKRYLPGASESKNDQRSMLAVPILIKSPGHKPRMIGAIFADIKKLAYFSCYDLDLIEQVANFSAALIERTLANNLLQETANTVNVLVSKATLRMEKHKDRLPLAPLGEDLFKARRDLLKKIVEGAIALTNASSGVIHLIAGPQFTKETEPLITKSFTFEGKVGLPNNDKHPDPKFGEDGTSLRLLRRAAENRGKTVVSNAPKQDDMQFSEGADDGDVSSSIKNSGIKTTLGIALISHDGWPFGLLYLNSKTKETFNEIERAALRHFASQAAVALQTTELIWDQSLQHHVLESIRAFSLTLAETIAAQKSPAHVLAVAAQKICSLVATRFEMTKAKQDVPPEKSSGDYPPGVFVPILLVDRPGLLKFEAAWPQYHLAVLHNTFSEGFPFDDTKDPKYKDIVDKGIIGKCASTKEVQMVGDISKVEWYVKYASSTQSELAVPILSKDKKVLGVINVEHPDMNAFDEDDEKLVQAFADILATYVELANLYDQNQQSMESLLSTVDTFETIRKITSTTQAIQRMTHLTQKAIKDCIWAFVLTRDKGTENYQFFSHKPYPEHQTITFLKCPITNKVFNSTRRDDFRKIEHYSGDFFDSFKKAGVESGVCLPIKRVDFEGVLWILFDRPKTIQNHEVKLYEFYASQIYDVYDLVKREFGETHERLGKGIHDDYESLKKVDKKYTWLSYVTSYIGLVIVALGFLIFSTGVVNDPQNNPTSLFMGIAGLLVQLATAFVFARADVHRKQSERYHQERTRSHQLTELLHAANQITDIAKRDALKEAIIKDSTGHWFREEPPTSSTP